MTFLLAAAPAVALSLLLLLAGQKFLESAQAVGAWVHFAYALEGVVLGLGLGFADRYYPSLEGLCASLVVAVYLLGRDGWQINLDSFVELLLKFEAHFAALYFTAFLVFLSRGGGVAFPFFVGMRYLRFKMITAISVAGMALGVAAMVVVLSVMSGFENDLKDRIIGTNAHAIVQKRGLDFSEWPLVMEKARRVPGVMAASPFIYAEVMISSEFNISGVFVRGIQPSTAVDVTDLASTVEEGNLKLLEHPELLDKYLQRLREPARLPGIFGLLHNLLPLDAERGTDPPPAPPAEERDEIVPGLASGTEAEGEPRQLVVGAGQPRELPSMFIGSELKKILKVQLGDRVNIVSPLSEEIGPSGPVPRARTFRVAGVFATGMYEYDAKSVYVSLGEAQKFFGLGDAVSGVALRLDDFERAGEIAGRVLAALDGYPYFTRTWYQMNRNLFTALKMEKVGMFILVVIVTLVSAFGIISTLIMLVWEKVKEIAILKSMGATGDGVMKVFMFEGITIGMVGTLLGLVLGFTVCVLLRRFGFELDPEVYYIQNLPVNMDAVEFVLVAAIALHIGFLATVYPAGRAARLRPAEGLRYE